MSSIDSVDNVHCADIHFNDTILPIYWVQNNLYHDRTGEIVCPKDLMVGGGSGEHPALHIKNADLLPLFLLLKHIENTNDFDVEFFDQLELTYIEKLKSRTEDQEEKKLYEDYCYSYEIFMCIADWPISTLSEVQINFKKLNTKDCFVNSAEMAILISLANFIVFDMPKQFFEEDIYDIINDNKEIYTKNYCRMFHFSSPLNSQKMGRVIKNGKVFWGYSLLDYVKLNEKKWKYNRIIMA